MVSEPILELGYKSKTDGFLGLQTRSVVVRRRGLQEGLISQASTNTRDKEKKKQKEREENVKFTRKSV